VQKGAGYDLAGRMSWFSGDWCLITLIYDPYVSPQSDRNVHGLIVWS